MENMAKLVASIETLAIQLAEASMGDPDGNLFPDTLWVSLDSEVSIGGMLHCVTPEAMAVLHKAASSAYCNMLDDLADLRILLNFEGSNMLSLEVSRLGKSKTYLNIGFSGLETNSDNIRELLEAHMTSQGFWEVWLDRVRRK